MTLLVTTRCAKRNTFLSQWVSSKPNILVQKLLTPSGAMVMLTMPELTQSLTREPCNRLLIQHHGTLSMTTTMVHSLQMERTRSSAATQPSGTRLPSTGNSASARSSPDSPQDSVHRRARPATSAWVMLSTEPTSMMEREPPSTRCWRADMPSPRSPGELLTSLATTSNSETHCQELERDASVTMLAP